MKVVVLAPWTLAALEVLTLDALLVVLWLVVALLPVPRLVRPWQGLAAWDTGVERPGWWPPT